MLSENIDRLKIETIKVKISLSVHGSKIIIIVGHYNCADNPVYMETHLKQILYSVGVLE